MSWRAPGESMGAKAEWRVRTGVERALVRVLGRDLVCAACGRRLFRAVPFVWKGQLKLIGAYEHNVRVSFAGKDALELRHLMLDECPAPERPWVP